MSASIFEVAMYFERVLRESNEYKSLQRLCIELNNDPQAKHIYNQINYLDSQLQRKQMMGQEIGQQEIATLQSMETAAQQNEKIKHFMEADYRVNMLMMELNKIITKPLEELYGQLVEE